MKDGLALMILGALSMATNSAGADLPARTSGVMPNDAYVWQRAWTDAVRAAIVQHATNFTELIALAAEVTWRNGVPLAVRVPIDNSVLGKTGPRIGLALRVGPYHGPFRPDDGPASFLADLAASLLAQAAQEQLSITELQIDFDCAESKLDGYAIWVQAIRRRVSPIPVTITALPSWLNQSAFQRLIAAADGYVLQVHSLEKPKRGESRFRLCDPGVAQRAVEQAGEMGKPFRVALPAYGYRIAYDPSGRFIGLSAEGSSPTWPEGSHTEVVRAEPEAMAQLIQNWNRDRPRALAGVIWYRLPVAQDRLHWRWPTLAKVMRGIAPRADVRVEIHRPESALAEIDLVNVGSADSLFVPKITLRWSDSRLIAADALQGYDCLAMEQCSIQFRNKTGNQSLQAGETHKVGWLRFDKQTEVQIEISKPEKEP